MQLKKYELLLGDGQSFSIFFENYKSLLEMIDEIFLKKEYDFKLETKKPFIIDAGSNIGLTTLYLKHLYPLAHILCFEPDPDTFSLLHRNISINNIKGVELENKALFNKECEISYFGQIHTINPDSRGNSLFACWGKQRVSNEEIKVKATTLSKYITKPIDLLKLDIEGAEEIVLNDLLTCNLFNKIKNIIIEVHESEKLIQFNSLDRITKILDKNFHLDVTHKDNIILPREIDSWVKSEKPVLYVVTGVNKTYVENESALLPETMSLVEYP